VANPGRASEGGFVATLYYEREAYDGDRFVVDLRYVKLVLAELEAIGVPWRELDRSEPLGLARLVPVTAGSFVGRLDPDERAGLVERTKRARAEFGYAADDEPPQLDLALRALRERFATRYPGWAPTMGKDRVVDTVESSPHIGGEGDPEPLSNGETFKLPPRTESPDHRVRVGLLDTKLYPHPELDGRYLAESAGFLPAQTTTPTSPSAHAVYLAGLIVEKAPDAELIVRSVLDNLGTASSWDTANKMVGFLADDVAVLNMSFSCITADHEPPLTLARAVARLSPAVVLVAAAGNHGDSPTINPTTPAWPGAFDDVIAVGADRLPNEPAAFSPAVPWIALAALGENITSLFLPGDVEIVHRNQYGGADSQGTKKFGMGYARWHGTSAAAAKVSGAIARLAAGERISAHEAVQRLIRPPEPPSPLFTQVTKDIRPFEP
jgi:hypothetical protein